MFIIQKMHLPVRTLKQKKGPPVVATPTSLQRDDGFDPITPMISQNRRYLQVMKGILLNPGKDPVLASLPDTLQGIEAYLQRPCEMRVMPRTPVVLVFGKYEEHIAPASLFNRTYRGKQLLGPILCYGWKNNDIQPLGKAAQTEFLSHVTEYEVRV